MLSTFPRITIWSPPLGIGIGIGIGIVAAAVDLVVVVVVAVDYEISDVDRCWFVQFAMVVPVITRETTLSRGAINPPAPQDFDPNSIPGLERCCHQSRISS